MRRDTLPNTVTPEKCQECIRLMLFEGLVLSDAKKRTNMKTVNVTHLFNNPDFFGVVDQVEAYLEMLRDQMDRVAEDEAAKLERYRRRRDGEPQEDPEDTPTAHPRPRKTPERDPRLQELHVGHSAGVEVGGNPNPFSWDGRDD